MRLLIIFLLISGCSKSQGILGSKVERLPENPTLLTWTKVHEERFLSLVDENHVKYTSDFASSTSNLSAISGSAPSISGGNLVISNSVKYQSTSTTVAAWATAELTIASMGSAGDSNKLGPMFIKDVDEYIAAVYDKVRGYLQIIQNDVRLGELPYSINTTDLKIFLIVSGNSLSVWYQESGEEPTVGFSQNSTDDLKALDISEYKFGVYCLQSGGTTTHNVSSLRGSASGGIGLFNNKIVRNQDGSDYILAGKLLMTADLVNISNAVYQWNDANCVLLSIDTATFDVEIVGRFYFDRFSKRLGGQDLHVIWDGSNWLINYVPADRIGLAENSDFYFYLPYADIFTEIVVDEADLTIINSSGGNIGYDISTRLIGGNFVSATTNTFNACLYSGSDYDVMSNVSCYDDAEDWECAQWIHYNGSWYLTYSSYGDTRQIVLTYPDLDLVGFMNLPFVSDPEGRIPGYDWYCKQVNGRTIYHMIGFDTEEFEATIPVFGFTKFPWTLGNLVVWKATETKKGNEF